MQAGQVGLGYSTGLFSVPGYTVQHPAQHRPSSRDTQPGDSAAIRHPSGGRWGQLLFYSNIPYGQSSAKLPVILSPSHLVI